MTRFDARRKIAFQTLFAASVLRLNRRTFYRAERTKHTAITWIRPQQRLAVTTLVIVLASVGRHALQLGKAALRASQNRFKDDSVGHGTSLVQSGRIACVRGGLGQCLRSSFVRVIGNDRCLLVEINLDGPHTGHLIQRFFDSNWAQFAGHVFDVERDSFWGGCQRHYCIGSKPQGSSIHMQHLANIIKKQAIQHDRQWQAEHGANQIFIKLHAGQSQRVIQGRNGLKQYS